MSKFTYDLTEVPEAELKLELAIREIDPSDPMFNPEGPGCAYIGCWGCAECKAWSEVRRQDAMEDLLERAGLPTK